MLSYIKYFALVCFILIAVGAVFAGMYFRNVATDSIIKSHSVQQAYQLSSSLIDGTLCKHATLIERLASLSIQQRTSQKAYQSFSKLMAAKLGTAPFTEIMLSDDSGDVIYSQNNTNLPNITNSALYTQGSFERDTQSRVLPHANITYEDGRAETLTFVETVVTFDLGQCAQSTSGNSFTVVITVFDDISSGWDKLSFFQIVITAVLIGMFLVLCLIMLITSSKAEKIIDRQHEEKLQLEKEKESAEAQNKEKSMFLANVSHELRTPLNAIIGFSEIIKDEVMGPVGHPQYKEYVTDINTSGVHLLSLINDILDYSKAEARKLDIESVDIDLSRISHACLRLVEPRAKEADVILEENTPEHNVILQADPKRMKQVILNLLSNAVKFTPEGGKVSLRIDVNALEGEITLTVSDTGIGISHKDISKAMSPFGQIDSSLSRRYEGTGLGLPLTKKLTEIMGGSFDIKSEVGLGTSITLQFKTVADKTEKNASQF